MTIDFKPFAITIKGLPIFYCDECTAQVTGSIAEIKPNNLRPETIMEAMHATVPYCMPAGWAIGKDAFGKPIVKCPEHNR